MMLGTIEGFIFTGDAHAFSAERKVDGGEAVLRRSRIERRGNLRR